MIAVARIQGRGQVTLPKEVRQAVGAQPGDLVIFETNSDGKVELRVLRPYSLQEALELFRIEGPVNEAADREAWQDVAARDVLGSADD